MCFSATASFVASGILGVMGAIAYKQVKAKNQLLFALIPSLFAIQQAAEGFVWLSFSHAALEPWRSFFMYIFLLFAFIIWPVWIPLSMYYLEPVNRSKLIGLLAILGAVVSSYLAAGMISNEVVVTVFDCHIRYFLPYAIYNIYISSLLYGCVTIIPFFLSRIRYMPIFGLIGLLSYAVSYWFYYYVFISVWCFFCAILSICVLFILRDQKKTIDYTKAE